MKSKEEQNTAVRKQGPRIGFLCGISTIASAISHLPSGFKEVYGRDADRDSCLPLCPAAPQDLPLALSEKGSGKPK